MVPAWRLATAEGTFLILTRFETDKAEQRNRALFLISRFMAWKMATASFSRQRQCVSTSPLMTQMVAGRPMASEVADIVICRPIGIRAKGTSAQFLTSFLHCSRNS